MKTKLTGLAILILVIIAAVVYVFFSRKNQTAEISGYLGGEKIGLLEDEEVQDILKGRYHLVIDYSKAGSLDMITADFTDRDYLFPSNQTALELYEEIHGDPLHPQRRGKSPCGTGDCQRGTGYLLRGHDQPD